MASTGGGAGLNATLEVHREFIDLARTEDRDADQERRLDVLRAGMADRLMARPAAEVYDA